MIGIKQYFAETFYKNEYYNFKFNYLLNQSISKEIFIIDDQDAIEKFKNLILPYNDNDPRVDVPPAIVN